MDHLSADERSALMATVKSKGNKSTETAVASIMRAAGIKGWRRHPKRILGRPDFYFPKAKIALFVDGCFWHACPVCQRNMPATREGFWRNKIEGNRLRDNRIRRALRVRGLHVFRVWEHAVMSGSWLHRLLNALDAKGSVK